MSAPEPMGAPDLAEVHELLRRLVDDLEHGASIGHEQVALRELLDPLRRARDLLRR